MKKNFLFKGVSVLGAMLLLATSVMPGLQYAFAESTSTEATWDYVHDEASWQTAYDKSDSALKAYEDYYRYEDLWSNEKGRRALLDDIRCTFESYDDENGSNLYAEGIIKGVKYAPWFGTDYNEVEVVENSVPGFDGTHFYLEKDAINLDLIEHGSDTLYQLYSDSVLSNSVGIWVKIKGCSYPGFTKSGKAWNATAWTVVKLPKPFRGTISISYDGAAPVYPRGEKARDFNYGFGVASIPAITAYDESTFQQDKLKVTLLTPVACIEKGENDDCYGSLRAAVDNAIDGDEIYLLADDEVSFAGDGNDKLEINNKSITIDGGTHTLFGDSNKSTYHEILVKGGTSSTEVKIENLNFKNFGNSVATSSITSPIYVSTSFAGKFTLKNAKIENYNRQAIVLGGGTFELDNFTVIGDTARDYQQGIEIVNANGTIKNSNIKNIKGNGSDEAWAILNYGNGNVEVTNTTIEDSEGGVSIGVVPAAGYPNNIAGTITLGGTNNFTATKVLALNPSNDGYALGAAVLSVTAGSYNGAIEKSTVAGDASAKIEISGGKFSVDPSTYVVAGKYAKSISEGALKYEVDVKPSSSSSSGGGGSRKTTTKDDAKANTGDTATVDDKNAEDKNDETKADDDAKVSVDANKNGNADTAISFSQEFKDAYKFAHDNGITTKDSIEEADMYGPLTRIAMAKMLSQYAINVLGKTPDTTKVVPNFPDVDEKLDADYNNGVTLAYQLGIMGIGIKEFRPFDLVTRAEFGTALSRLLYGLADGEGDEWYKTHLDKLMEEMIITNDNPDLQELRGYVMIMLMRSAQ